MNQVIKKAKKVLKAMPKASKLPMTVKQIRKEMDDAGSISFYVELELSDLMCSVDCLNDAASEWLSGGDNTCLENISYRMVQVLPNGNLLMEISGSVKNWLENN